MLNPIATEALYSATYVDNYIDSVENLPDDVQRYLSRIRDIDVQYRGHLHDVDHYYELWKSLQNTADSSANRKARAIARMQQSLIQAQELGDEKMQVVNQLQELIDFKTRQLDTDQKNLDIKEDVHQQHRIDIMQQMDDYSGPTPPKQSRLQSPTRGELIGSTYGIGGNGNGSGSSSAGGRSTPNSERSGNMSTVINSTPSGVSGIVNNSNLMQLEVQQRNASKRSRRRNDTVNMLTSMEMGSNESNSATEIGNNLGSERNSTQKTNSGAGQKKNSQGSGLGGANGGNMATGNSGSGNSGKKKKRKSRGGQSNSNQVSLREETPPPDPIDPDEPTYCVCNQISFGEMILCDNDLCPIEWFHFSCVSLVLKPKGKWFCPNCRGDRPNVMKPKAQFLKELERYNKEKEEKT